MKILLTHPYCWPEVQRGGERLFHDLASYLARAGHQVTAVASGRPAGVTGVDGYELRRVRSLEAGLPLGLRLDRPVSYLPAAAVAARRARPDLIHGMFHLDGIAGRVARRPHLVHVQGMPSRAALDRNRLHRRAFAASVAHADVVVAVSAAAAEAFESEFGRPAVAVHNGVDTAAFAGVGPDGRDPRPTVLFPGDPADPRKRLPVLVEALRSLRSAWPELRLAVAARVDRGTADGLVSALPGAVDLLGVDTPAAMPAAYGRAWVTCLPAVREAFGLVVVEALAAGRPAVAVADGGVGEVLAEPRWLAAPDDAASLAQALDRALHDAARPETAGHCRALAAPFDWSAAGPRFEALYADVLAGRIPAHRTVAAPAVPR